MKKSILTLFTLAAVAFVGTAPLTTHASVKVIYAGSGNSILENNNWKDNVQCIQDKLASLGIKYEIINWSNCPEINIPDINLPDCNTPDNNTPDNNTPDNNTPDNNTPDNNTPDNNTPDNNTPDNNTPDNNTPDNNTPDNNTPDNSTPDNNTPDNSTPDNNTPDNNTQSSYVKEIVRLVNEERAKAGLSPVTLDQSVTTAAQIRAVEIETSFSHTRPNGSSFSSVLKEQGISYKGAGENIAWGQKDPAAVMNAWMNSDGHRANILNPKFTTIGVGYYQNAAGRNYWSQLFTY